MLRGVKSVLPGYAGGIKDNPSYDEVSSGVTGHAEVVKIEFDPLEISYRDLLTVFFATHDPTTVNRQGNDVGTQYRSVILVTSSLERLEAEKFVDEINASSVEGKSVVTEIKPLEKFYPAENYHRNYYARNTGNPYCEVVINPKLEKVQIQFSELLNKNNRATTAR